MFVELPDSDLDEKLLKRQSCVPESYQTFPPRHQWSKQASTAGQDESPQWISFFPIIESID